MLERPVEAEEGPAAARAAVAGGAVEAAAARKADHQVPPYSSKMVTGPVSSPRWTSTCSASSPLLRLATRRRWRSRLAGGVKSIGSSAAHRDAVAALRWSSIHRPATRRPGRARRLRVGAGGPAGLVLGPQRRQDAGVVEAPGAQAHLGQQRHTAAHRDLPGSAACCCSNAACSAWSGSARPVVAASPAGRDRLMPPEGRRGGVGGPPGGVAAPAGGDPAPAWSGILVAAPAPERPAVASCSGVGTLVGSGSAGAAGGAVGRPGQLGCGRLEDGNPIE